MVIFIYIIVVIILIFFIGLVIALNNFDNNIKNLFLESDKINKHVFHPSQLSGLPNPVKQYFNCVLKDGQRYINYVRLKHHGRFKTALKGRWETITGEEYFAVNTPVIR